MNCSIEQNLLGAARQVYLAELKFPLAMAHIAFQLQA
jgi:hypothetical protein